MENLNRKERLDRIREKLEKGKPISARWDAESKTMSKIMKEQIQATKEKK